MLFFFLSLFLCVCVCFFIVRLLIDINPFLPYPSVWQPVLPLSLDFFAFFCSLSLDGMGQDKHLNHDKTTSTHMACEM